jgi:predicted SAM-dependent methyltransferase
MSKIKKFVKSNKVLFGIINPFFQVYRKIPVTLRIAKKKIFRLTENNKNLMVNIGAGQWVRRNWKVLEFNSAYYSSFIDYDFDLMSNKQLPFLDNSVYLFYTSHTFEHLPQNNCEHILKEAHRCLKTGGGIRITVPDFDRAYNLFLKGELSARDFLDVFATFFKDKVDYKKVMSNFSSMSKEKFADYYSNKVPTKSQRENCGNHLNWFTNDKLIRMLKKAGFKAVYVSKEQESKFPEMRGRGFFTGFDSTYPKKSLFVEAIK